jgi:pimeloyl-ACP methyl ester carboxylesterase
LREITLIGHSVGGGEIVRYLTRHHSERVSRIVLVAATAPFPMQTDDNPGGIPKSMADAVAAARAADRPRWMAEMTASFFALDLARNKVSPEFIHWMRVHSLDARYGRAVFAQSQQCLLRGRVHHRPAGGDAGDHRTHADHPW